MEKKSYGTFGRNSEFPMYVIEESSVSSVMFFSITVNGEIKCNSLVFFFSSFDHIYHFPSRARLRTQRLQSCVAWPFLILQTRQWDVNPSVLIPLASWVLYWYNFRLLAMAIFKTSIKFSKFWSDFKVLPLITIYPSSVHVLCIFIRELSNLNIQNARKKFVEHLSIQPPKNRDED